MAAEPAPPGEIDEQSQELTGTRGEGFVEEFAKEVGGPSPVAATWLPDLFSRGREGIGNRKWHIVAASSVALVCGMGIVAIEACPPSTSVRAAQPWDDVESAGMIITRGDLDEPKRAPDLAGAVAEFDAELDPALLYESAVTSLRGLMESPSPRLQRIAAMALSRTGDADAVSRLHTLLRRESSILVRVQIAYGLARAGEESGRSILVKSLSSRKRDARLDAARFLVELGDHQGAKVLRRMLKFRNFRIGAAGLLARLDDPKGKQLLRGALTSRVASKEIKMRSVVALGRAGDSSVREQLVEILEGGRYQVGAALALAALEDPIAVPALERQLGLDSFRVRAALGLRRLGAKVDLAPLAMALQTGNDVTRVTSAEAILVMTGPEELAELD